MASDHRVAGDAPEPPAGDGTGFERQAIGAYLRRQRELRGITAEELARTTRIPLRSLERLEAGSFDGEADGFVRGFVRTVAAALGLDPDETVARMLAEPSGDDGPGFHASPHLPRAIVGLAVVTLLALAVGLVQVVARRESAAPPARTDEVVRRLDPVRALAEAQGGVEASVPGAVAAPPPEPARR
jgi:cytoskeleton protein RodZ